MAPTLEEHKLQLLRERYISTIGWFVTRVGCKVRVGPPDPRTSEFSMMAEWDGGGYVKRFSTSSVRTLGRRGCALFFAEEFVREALRAKGEEAE